MRRLSIMLLGVVLVLAAGAGCERTQTITLPGTTDTLIVQLPGRRDTIIVPRLDTLYVPKPETTFVQLPGRVDTVIVQRVDTTVVRKTDTLIVIQHDTVVKHDTITHTDTVWLSRVPAYLCIYMTMGDTLAAFNWRDTPYCDAAHLSLNVPGTHNVLLNVDTLVMKLPSVQAALTRMANTPPSPLILPRYWSAHRQ